MSDSSDSSIVDLGTVPADRVETSGSATPANTAQERVVAVQPGPDAVMQVGPPAVFDDTPLLSRFLIGVVFLGSDALMQRLRSIQKDIEAGSAPLAGDDVLEPESELKLLRYLSIGLFVRGRRAVVIGLRRGAHVSLDATRSVLGGFDRLADNPLTGPMRRSIAARARNLGEKASEVIGEGRREEQEARLLANYTIWLAPWSSTRGPSRGAP